MAPCRCTETQHGHESPCNEPTATENDQKCEGCESAAAKEFALADPPEKKSQQILERPVPKWIY